MKKRKFLIFILLIVLIFTYYYFILPPLYINSPSFWIFLAYIIILTAVGAAISVYQGDKKKLRIESIIRGSKLAIRTLALLPIILVILLLVNLIASPIFSANAYAKRIVIDESHNFNEDVKEADFTTIPLLDKASTRKLGDRVMGELPELVSQFDVSDLYTQINYENRVVRVTPLEYSGFIKYLSNRKKGVPAYIKVDSTSGKASLVRLEKGMKYLPSAIFSEDLHRKLRFSYPKDEFGRISFEIDEDGKPFWIAPVISYKAIGLRADITHIITLDPATGETKKYPIGKVPAWIDHVAPAEIILSQTNDWGKYRGGFFNSIFGQKNVVACTEGYNYLALNDDIYLYTGITSTISDESNLGFILSNLRTKETRFYKAPGAEEYSAMDSAKGQVQQMKYKPTFPLLINLRGKPTYIISLKDNAGLVKMYAFVDVADYQRVTVSESSLGIEAAAKRYIDKNVDQSASLVKEKIRVSSISMAIIDGNSFYFIVDEQARQYFADISIAKETLPFVRVGDTLEVSFKEGPKVIEIKALVKE